VNPSRGLAAALLCALLGAAAAAHPMGGSIPAPEAGTAFKIPAGKCGGRGGPEAQPILSGPVYDLRAKPIASEVLAEWLAAGYSVDRSSSHLLSPGGRPVAAAEVARLSAPFDAAVDTMTNGSWSALIFQGYRLQDADCRLLDPEKRTPVTRIEILELERMVGGQHGTTAVEELAAGLRGADPRRPVPASVRARMADLEARGEVLPDALKRALADPGLTAGEVGGLAQERYARAMRAWDASRDFKSVAEGALPPVAGYNVPAPRAGRIETWEKTIGDGFSSDIQELFSRTAAGRELLARFRDPKGRPDLPKVTVLKMSQRPGDAGYGGAAAVYDETSRTVVLSHWYVVGQVLAAAKPDQREKLGEALADSRGLAQYLRTHPAERAAVADRVDVVVFHELTHAWQLRRQALAVEMTRGNAPSGIVIAREEEAFFAMDAYLHQKLMNDPAAALRNDEFPEYLGMISDPEKYRDRIAGLYQRQFAGSSDFPTLERIQAERKTVLGVPAGSGVAAWTRAALERLGLARGDAALKQARDDQAATERAYLAAAPRMQAEAASRLPDAFVKAGRPDYGLKVLAAVPSSARGPVDRRPALAAETEAMLARPAATLTLDERLEAFGLLSAELQRERKGWSAATEAAYRRDVFSEAERLADSAAAESDRARRADLVGRSREWLNASSPKEPRAAALKRRLDALEKRP
jgi:hypothetical protein